MATKTKLNYKESPEILEEIRKAKKVLLVCHVGADPDSIISCLVAKKIISFYGVEADIFSNEPFSKLDRQLDVDNEIKVADVKDIDFTKYDLLMVLDVPELKRLGIYSALPQDLKLINIDHHESNQLECLKISDTSFSSTTEMIFHLIEDLNYQPDDDTINKILTGILSDTDGFNYSTTPRLFRTVSKLIEMGASYNLASVFLWRNNSEDQLKFWSKMLAAVQVDREHKFAYSALPYMEYEQFKDINHPARSVADKFLRTIEGTDFGIVMLEHKVGELKISVRSRVPGFGCLPILKSLGGGGHHDGGGAMIVGLPFKEAVEKVLSTARNFANENVA